MKRYAPLLVLLAAGCSMQPLNKAARRGDVASLKAQLDKGADPNLRGIVGETPLMAAAFAGRTEAAKTLLAAGADVNARWVYGTPLSYAASRGQTETARLLLDKGAKVDDMAIEAAASNGFPALARELAQRRDAASGKAAPTVDAPKYAAAPVERKRDADVALVIAVDQENDAEAVASHLKALGFSGDRVAVLAGRKASRSQIAAHVEEWLPSKAKDGARVVVYYSGRTAKDKNGQTVVLPFDYDEKFPASTTYPLKSLVKGLTFLETAAAAEDATVLAAAKPGETAGEMESQRHGLFTYYLLQALSEGKRTAKDLVDYIAPRVQEQARKQGRDQTATLSGPNSEI